MAGPRQASLLLLGLAGLGFVGLGLPDGVLGVAWPSIRASYALPLDALGALLVTTTAGYVAASFASGRLLARMSVGSLLAWSCLLTAASLLGYAVAPAWGMMVVLGCVAGLGAGAIDAGINTHVATHHSARALGLLHACYGVGTAAGPAIMTSVLMAGLAWQRGYVIVGVAQVALALSFALTRRRWPAAPAAGGAAPTAAPIASTLRLPVARWGIAAFFLYVGLEATAGVWVFSLLHGSRGVTMAAAGTVVSVYWAGLTVGRLVAATIPPGLGPGTILRVCIATMALAAAVLALDLGPAPTLAAVATLGIAAGPVFPTLMATTPERLAAAHTANAVGFQVAAAAVGQSLLPALVGTLADGLGLETLPIALLAGASLLAAVHERLDRTAPVPAPARPSPADPGGGMRAPERGPEGGRGPYGDPGWVRAHHGSGAGRPAGR
jgi:fucose permease